MTEPTVVASAMSGGSAAEAADAIIGSLRDGLGGATPALVLFFASTEQPHEELAPRLTEAFPGAVVLGASSAGEFTEVGDRKGQVSALAVAGDFAIHAGLGRGLKHDPAGAVTRALAEVPTTHATLPHRAGVVLLDPLSGTGEEATLIAASVLGPDVRLAGGAA
ncbi:MAG: hypothetical protein KC619_13985, partial [Myxococcales bacterium]|nr:hypothetical protein [Myxococcales bacterium]